MTMFSYAQKVDFDMSNRQPKEVTEDGYQSWAVVQGQRDTMRVGINETDSFDIVINVGPEGTVNRTLRPQWNKALVTDARKARLVGDAVAVLGDDGDGNTPELVSESATINLVLKGMAPGHHTMLAYMNCVRNKQGETAPIDVIVDGTTVLTGIKMTCDAETPSATAQAYVEFDAAEGEGCDNLVRVEPRSGSGVSYHRSLPQRTGVRPAQPEDYRARPHPGERRFALQRRRRLNRTVMDGCRNRRETPGLHRYVGGRNDAHSRDNRTETHGEQPDNAQHLLLAR